MPGAVQHQPVGAWHPVDQAVEPTMPRSEDISTCKPASCAVGTSGANPGRSSASTASARSSSRVWNYELAATMTVFGSSAKFAR